MAATFVVIPQWQGSVSARAMRLADGADAIRGDLPASATRVVEVPVGAGEALGTGVHRYSSLLRVAEHAREELAAVAGQAVVIGGDCAVTLPAIERALATDADTTVLWFDAHPDLNTAETSPSGAFGGMVLRALLGDGPEGLVPSTPLSPARVVLCGVRDIDPGEEEYLQNAGITLLDVDQLTDADALLAALGDTSSVYLHIDLDVLDPATIAGLDYPMPFGLSVESLTALIAAVKGRASVLGATIAGFAPASPADAADDLPSILRIIGAITRG
ncbi:arginase family protein [Glaciibacter flavus]|uniref:arginase family protein n=1 Tax=Orlajensenia flava TaxID=2565934 RepID=UPI003B0022D7